MKKVVLKILRNSQENTSARVTFFIKLPASGLMKKETLAEVFSREFCEIIKNTFFYRTPLDDCFCLLEIMKSFKCGQVLGTKQFGCQSKPTNCLSVFDHFMGLAL